MDNGQMARWVARLEHIERMQAQNRDEQFWRDIQPDDLDMRGTQTALSSHVQPASVVLILKKSLASLRARLGTNRTSEQGSTKAGYEQSCVGTSPLET